MGPFHIIYYTGAVVSLLDPEGLESPEIEACIAIAEREDVPLIMGLKSIAETHDFIVNFRNKTLP